MTDELFEMPHFWLNYAKCPVSITINNEKFKYFISINDEIEYGPFYSIEIAEEFARQKNCSNPDDNIEIICEIIKNDQEKNERNTNNI